ncbi:hypothetical protein ACKVMT_13220 [Halobacteriales archaeon Cl-PHB]
MAAAEPTDGDEKSYGGVPGAFPYAFRQSESRLFRSYAVLGGLLTAFLLVAFVLAIVVAFGNTFGAVGGTFTFSRAFVAVIGTAVGLPVVTPVLLVARKHRRTGSTRTYDRAMAVAGYLYGLALYLGLVMSVPPQYREDPSGPLGPVVDFLYGLPQVAGLVPLLVAVAVGYLLHRRYR